MLTPRRLPRLRPHKNQQMTDLLPCNADASLAATPIEAVAVEAADVEMRIVGAAPVVIVDVVVVAWAEAVALMPPNTHLSKDHEPPFLFFFK